MAIRPRVPRSRTCTCRACRASPVDLAGPAAADVADHELERATDRRVGVVALPERVDARFMPIARAIGPFTMTSGPENQAVREQSVRVELVGACGLDRGEHHRQVLGPATGQHRVHRDLLDRALDEVGRRPPRRCVRVAVGAAEHARDTLGRRAHHRQPVGEAPPNIASVSSSPVPSSSRWPRSLGSIGRDRVLVADVGVVRCATRSRAGRRGDRRRGRRCRPVLPVRTRPAAVRATSMPATTTATSARCRPRARTRRRARGRRYGGGPRPSGNSGSSWLNTVRACRRRRARGAPEPTMAQVGQSRFTTAMSPSGRSARGSRVPACAEHYQTRVGARSRSRWNA